MLILDFGAWVWIKVIGQDWTVREIEKKKKKLMKIGQGNLIQEVEGGSFGNGYIHMADVRFLQ
jgi:hypothetical protein